jgi:PKD repeat protein
MHTKNDQNPREQPSQTFNAANNMRFSRTFFLLTFLLAAAWAHASEYTIEIAWSIDPVEDVGLAGYRLYDLQHNRLCETENPDDTSMVCTVEVSGSEGTFTLVSFSTEGVESDPSDPFTIVFEEPAPLEAIFTFATDDTSLNVSFDAYDSTGPITQYSWNFGDGTVDSGVTVAHLFDTAGTYSVSLTVQDDNGETHMLSHDVVVGQPAGDNQPPTASLVITTGTPAGASPLTVGFNAGGSSDPEGEELSFAWDFGDGATATGGAQISHQYTTPGNYTATVTVTDPQGAGDSETSQLIMVTSGTGDTGTATAVIDAGPSGPAPVTVSFNATSSTPAEGEEITDYQWNFGDGSTAAGTEVQHLFTVDGNYTVVLTITDSAGNQAESSKTIYVSAAAGSPNATVPTLIQIYKLLLLKQ